MPERLQRFFANGWLYCLRNFNKRKDITLLHCMAHARRKFDEAKDNDLAKASYVLAEIQKLYTLERHEIAKGMDDGEL